MDAKNTDSAAIAAPTKYTSIRQPRRPYARIVQNLIVWLDENIDENNDHYQNTITNLREVSNTVNTFTDVNECVHYISDIKTTKTVLIFSGALGRTTVPIVHDMTQINTIYIFCDDNTCHKQWTEQYSKIKGVFADIERICEALKKAIDEYDQNTIPISFVSTNDDETNRNLDQLDQSFMYTQILKEILLTSDFKPDHFMELITYCREQCKGNPTQVKNMDNMEKEYSRHTPIWWYTYQCFLYSMLNCALRTMEMDLIIKLGFFIRDLHEHITHLHSELYTGHHQSDSFFVVCRDRDFSQTDFDQLEKTKGGLLLFNNFLSTSLNRIVSLAFAKSSQYNSDLIGVLFQISVDSSTLSTLFANVHDIGYYPEKEEILFSMHSIFRIGEIRQIDGNNRLWEVDLMLTSDHDPQLFALTEHIPKETFPHMKGWYRLGELLVELGQFDKAQLVYDALLDQTTDDSEKTNIYHQLGRVKHSHGEYTEAIIFYEKVLEIYQKTLPPNQPSLATSYNNIGLVYHQMASTRKHFHLMKKHWKSTKKLFLQIVLIWLLLTTISVQCISKWLSTRTHFHLMKKHLKFERVLESTFIS